MTAASAALQRPLAARNDVLTVLPAPLADEVLDARIAEADAVAIIKIGRHFNRIRDLLAKLNLIGQSGYLERVSLPEQRVLPLSAVAEHSAPYFSMVLVYKGAEDWIAGLDIAGAVR
jgi:precorrin-2/cobalt-factor-2 C20-methyltransferase